MLSLTKSAAVGALAIAALSSVATAAPSRSVRISNGPRPDQYMMMRVPRMQPSSNRPYALTGQDETRAARRDVHPTPLHLKGPRGEY